MGDIDFDHPSTSLYRAAETVIHSTINMSENSLTKHVCSQCNNVYNSLTYLAMHIKAKHEVKPDLKCNFCEFKTPTTQTLKIHKKTNHSEISLKCNWCTFQTRREDDLI